MDEPNLEKSVSIILRPYDHEVDAPFVYSSWRNGVYYGCIEKITDPNDVFFKEFTKKIKRLLNTATTQVACLEGSPLVVIGYSVYTGTHLHWVYVKKDYRRQGVARLLCPPHIETTTPHLTIPGDSIREKKKWTIQGDEQNDQK